MKLDKLDLSILKRLQENGKIKIKGSAFKDQKKEPIFKQFLLDVTNDMLKTKGKNTLELYESYVEKIYNKKIDIKDFATKKTVTQKVLNPNRTQERRLLNAIGDRHVSEGDKIWVYNCTGDEVIKLIDDFNNDLDINHYFKRLHATMKILANIVDMELYPNYSLKREQKVLIDLIDRRNCDRKTKE